MVNSRRAKSLKTSLRTFRCAVNPRVFEKRIGGPNALKGNFQYPVLPLRRIRGRPNQHEFIDDVANWRRLLHEEHAGAGTSFLKERAKVSRHGLEIVRNKNSILLGGQGQDRRVGNPFEVCVVRGEEINCRLSTPATANDRIVEVGVRQEANHPLASSRWLLLSRALNLRF